MGLKYKLDSLDTVDEAIAALYKEHKQGDGNVVYILQVEGAVPSERLDQQNQKIKEFRNTNTALANRLRVFAEAAGIELDDHSTPAELEAALADKAEELDRRLKDALKGKGPKAEEVEQLVAQRVEAFKSAATAKEQALLAKLKEAQEGLASSHTQLEHLMVEQAVLAEGSKRGLRGTAHRDLVTRAKGTFRVKDGKVRALADDGETPVYSQDGVNEMTISEWVEAQASKDAPHLFESSSGGGASGSSGGAGRNGAAGGRNPFAKESWNLKAQMQLMVSDPEMAKRKAAEAGVKLPARMQAAGRA